MSTKPIITGLCGGIASGKSTIAGMFSQLGAGVIDADRIGHRLLNTPLVKKRLVRVYGERILNKKSGRINRQQLGLISFAHLRNLKVLNRIIHPFILKEIKAQIKKLAQQLPRARRFIVLDAALLVETGLARHCDYLIFVKASGKHREQRVARSRGWSGRELHRREKFQVPILRKQHRADFIVNNTSLACARQQVQQIFRRLTRSVMASDSEAIS